MRGTTVWFYDDPCVWCGQKHTLKRMTREHVIPVSRGGALSQENQVIACRTCNRRRGNTGMLLWLLALRVCNRNSLSAQRMVNALRTR